MKTPEKTSKKKSRGQAKPKAVVASPAGHATMAPARLSTPRAETPGAPAGPGDGWDASVSDTAFLGGRCAANAAERHITLDHAVSNIWAAEDIGTIRRVESNGRCMWVMWRRNTEAPL